MKIIIFTPLYCLFVRVAFSACLVPSSLRARAKVSKTEWMAAFGLQWPLSCQLIAFFNVDESKPWTYSQP